MKVYGLVGKSGTGKSHYVQELRNQISFDVIIDDGLCIYNGQVVAGSSSKFEKTTSAAVRRAIFFDDAHQEEVSQFLKETSIHSVLILGTSLRMIEKIRVRLSLLSFEEIFSIEDLVSRDYLLQAQQYRNQGLHAIPVQTAELLRHNRFSEMIKKIMYKKRGEKITVVHAAYHLGEMLISPSAVKETIYILFHNFPNFSIEKINIIEKHITIEVIYYTRNNVIQASQVLQKTLFDYLFQYLNFVASSVNIKIKRIE